MSGQAEAGWYPDPSGSGRQRYYDGTQWTEHYDDGAGAAAAAPQAAAGYGAQAAGGGGYAAQGMREPDLSPVGYVKKVLTENYANFSGRARRAEYWWFYLFTIVTMVVLFVLGAAILGDAGIFLAIIGILALFVPSLAVTVRRLHDTGKSGWYYFVSLIPFVGGIILIVFLATDSERGTNQYGPSPKY